MENQNIFDDPYFFSSYQSLREKSLNFNDMLEQPNMKALLPDLAGKTVLDIGCGSGKNAFDFSLSAKHVLAIDISEKMLSLAMKENNNSNITYKRLAMEDLSALDGPFDFIYSSLAFHYCLDFTTLIKDCYRLLSCGGILLFSQMHPINTANKANDRYVEENEDGEKYYPLSDYQSEGERHINWYVDVIQQHRKLSTIINTLTHNGFIITDCVEPCPSKKDVRQLKRLERELVRPSFIIFKAKKGE